MLWYVLYVSSPLVDVRVHYAFVFMTLLITEDQLCVYLTLVLATWDVENLQAFPSKNSLFRLIINYLPY